jgi:hypothetical protein
MATKRPTQDRIKPTQDRLNSSAQRRAEREKEEEVVRLDNKGRIYDMCERFTQLKHAGHDVSFEFIHRAEPNYISFNNAKFVVEFSLSYANSTGSRYPGTASLSVRLHDTSNEDEFAELEEGIANLIAAAAETARLKDLRTKTLRSLTEDQRKAIGEGDWRDPEPDVALAERIIDADDDVEGFVNRQRKKKIVVKTLKPKRKRNA